jgi:hypothetical protein
MFFLDTFLDTFLVTRARLSLDDNHKFMDFFLVLSFANIVFITNALK